MYGMAKWRRRRSMHCWRGRDRKSYEGEGSEMGWTQREGFGGKKPGWRRWRPGVKRKLWETFLASLICDSYDDGAIFWNITSDVFFQMRNTRHCWKYSIELQSWEDYTALRFETCIFWITESIDDARTWARVCEIMCVVQGSTIGNEKSTGLPHMAICWWELGWRKGNFT